jgi:hypothetical protein
VGHREAAPLCITAGPDGNLWFTESDANQIGEFVLAAPPLPQVVSIAPVSSKKEFTALNVTYNEPVTNSASSTALYDVFGGVTKVIKKHRETLFSKSLRIKSVGPGTTSSAVTINLAKPFKGAVDVTVNGSVSAQNGATSDINFTEKL